MYLLADDALKFIKVVDPDRTAMGIGRQSA